MLTHPTLDQLRALKLSGMLKALQEQEQMPDIDRLELRGTPGAAGGPRMAERENRRLATRLRFAKLKQAACLEDLDLKTPRQLDRALIRHWPTATGSRTPQHPDHRPHRRGQILAGLRPGPEGLPPGLQRALPAPAPAVTRTGRRPRRWALSQADAATRQGRRPDPGRLGPGRRPQRRQRRDLLEILDDRYASAPPW